MRSLLPTLKFILTLCLSLACTLNASAADEAQELRFVDFYHQPVGPAGLQISPLLQQADGKSVRLSGYMVHQESPAPGRFLLTPRPLRMSEHADGDADDLPPATVLVLLDASQQDWLVPHADGWLSIAGTLHLGRHEDDDGRVFWVRLQLAPDAIHHQPGPSVSAVSETLPPRL